MNFRPGVSEVCVKSQGMSEQLALIYIKWQNNSKEFLREGSCLLICSLCILVNHCANCQINELTKDVHIPNGILHGI